MGIAAPLALLGLGLLAPIIAMYLLKRRREEVAVSSVYLWERVVQDFEANAPWQKLRRNLLLLLQLLFLLLAVLALARPFLRTLGVTGQSLIVVVDNSLSMAATDGGNGTRWETARAEVLRLFDSLPDNGRMTVIRGGNGADLLAANSNDRIAIEQVLNGIQPVVRDSDLSQALTLAAAAASREADSEVVILSDGGVQVPASLPLDRPVRYIPIGTSGDNQAISTLSLTRTSTDTYDVFVQVTNYGTAEVTRRLVLEQDGESFTASDVILPAGASINKVLPITTGGAFTLSARLDGQDSLPTDDRAWAVPGAGGQRQVRLLTPSQDNRFLRIPFQLLPNTGFSQGRPISDSLTVDGNTADLLILDRWLPQTGLPGTTENLLIISPPAGNDVIQTTGVFTAPYPVRMGNVPALEDTLTFEDNLFFVEARRGDVPAWGTVVLEDSGTGLPLLWVGEYQGRRVAVINFALYGRPEAIETEGSGELILTNFVYHPAYPVLMANLATYLLAGPAGGLAGQSVAPGTVLNLPLLDSDRVLVTQPSGGDITIQAEGGSLTGRYVPTQPGIYTVTWPDSTQPPIQFAVNPASPQESNIAPQTTLELTTSGSNGAVAPQAANSEARLEWWRPLLFIGLIILVVEWLVYQKDALIRLQRRLQPTTR